MEKIFEDMLASEKSDKEKLAIVEIIIRSAPKPGTITNLHDASHKLLRCAINVILNGKNAFLIRQSLRVFDAWSIKEIRVSFFSTDEVSALLLEDCVNPINAITLLIDVMQSLKDSDNYDELCFSVSKSASAFAIRHRRFAVLYKFCGFLLKFPECVPSGDDLYTLCYSLLNGVCYMEQVTNRSEIVEYLTGCPAVIGGLFERIWSARANDRVTMQCLEMLFYMMISARDSRISLALGSVVQFVPSKLMNIAIEDITKAHVTSDEQITCVVVRLTDWLSWPNITNIGNWLLLLLWRLSAAGRFELLRQLAEEHVEKLLHRLTRVDLRENNVKIFLFLVTGNQDSKKTFNEIIRFIPKFYQIVRLERNPESEMFLFNFSVLIRSLIYFHAEKPAAYKIILDIIGYEEVQDDYETEFRKQSWTAKGASFRGVPVKSIPGKTGLRNGANICFLNSSIQLLAISESYSEQFIRRTFPTTARISTVLQKYFVYLKFSNRPSLNCSAMARLLLPSSFTWGAVQDSSEFFSHLIDGTMEEEEGCQALEKLAKKNFYYTVLHSHRCLNCDNETQLWVPNIDLGLAFDSEAASGNFGIRGGNQSVHSSDSKSDSEDYVLLEDMVSSFFRAENVSEYDCDKCTTQKQVAEKRTTFCETPNFLKITLNRFSYDHRGPQKITKATDIPCTLVVPVHRQNCVENDVFCLVGTIVHVGIGANSGHYYCIARNQTVVSNPPSLDDLSRIKRNSDFFEDKWFEFNDEDVSLTSFDAFSRSSSSSLSTPYVILYKKVTDAVLSGADSVLVEDSVRIPKHVLQLVAKDNEEYEKEQEIRKRPRSPPSPKYSWKKDNDDDDSSSPSDNFRDGPRMVF